MSELQTCWIAAGSFTYFRQMFVRMKTENKCAFFILLLFFYICLALGCGYFSACSPGGTQKYVLLLLTNK